MASFNKIILIGDIKETPEVMVTTGGDELAKFQLVVKRPDRADGFSEEDTIQVVAWRNVAEKMKGYQQGHTLLVEGRILTRTYDTEEGVRKWETEVEAREIKEVSSQGETLTSSQDAFTSAPVEGVPVSSIEEKVDEKLETDFNFDESTESETPPNFDKEIEEEVPF